MIPASTTRPRGRLAARRTAELDDSAESGFFRNSRPITGSRPSTASVNIHSSQYRESPVKVGFIGVGSMGSGMARNLIKAGHSLTVYNRTRSRAEALKEFGAQVAETPADAARNAEALITMLADDSAVEAVIFGPVNVIHSLPQGSVHISMSTISVEFSRRLQAAHKPAGQHYIAAPVFGRPDAAA